MNKLGTVSASRKFKIWWKLRKSKQKITEFVLQFLTLSLSLLPPHPRLTLSRSLSHFINGFLWHIYRIRVSVKKEYGLTSNTLKKSL